MIVKALGNDDRQFNLHLFPSEVWYSLRVCPDKRLWGTQSKNPDIADAKSVNTSRGFIEFIRFSRRNRGIIATAKTSFFFLIFWEYNEGKTTAQSFHLLFDCLEISFKEPEALKIILFFSLDNREIILIFLFFYARLILTSMKKILQSSRPCIL